MRGDGSWGDGVDVVALYAGKANGAAIATTYGSLKCKQTMIFFGDTSRTPAVPILQRIFPF